MNANLPCQILSDGDRVFKNRDLSLLLATLRQKANHRLPEFTPLILSSIMMLALLIKDDSNFLDEEGE
jgi:hypothetical protein